MSAFKNIGIKEYFKRYGFIKGIKRGIFNYLPFHYVKDYENKKLLYYNKISKKIEKKYLKFANVNHVPFTYNSNIKSPIWIYWNQGIESAPDIIKACINSVKKYADREVVILNNSNIKKYIVFSSEIEKMLSRYSIAVYSDVLRLSLLEHYGGLWIDATVFLTNKIPNSILNSDFFAFRDSFGRIENPALMCNWFINSKPNSEIVISVLNIFLKYLEKEKYVDEYLVVYIILTKICNKSDIYIPYKSSEYSTLLLDELDKKFNNKKYLNIIENTSIHKLTYKLNSSIKNDVDNLYSHIIGVNKYEKN